MDEFDEQYWNLAQVLAWAYLRDPALVRVASEYNEEPRFKTEKYVTPDGSIKTQSSECDPINDLHLEITAASRGGGAYRSCDQAENAVLAELR